MKFLTPEISWHERDPVYSVDFQPIVAGDCFTSAGISVGRLATCGTDKNIRIWSLKFDEAGRTSVNFLSTLSRHSRTVNIVRFCPDGKILASGGDDAVIMLWVKSDLAPTPSLFQDDEAENVETWTVLKTLRSHLEDVYDISWSSDGKKMVSGSVDNTVILWDVVKGHKLCILNDHKSFVQGVSFDPLDKFFASMSCDRSCRIFSLRTLNVVNDIKKASLPILNSSTAPQSSTPHGDDPLVRSVRLFHDYDTMKSFFRRLSFSPDGLLLLIPAGCLESTTAPLSANGINAPAATLTNTTYIFSRQNFTRPVAHLPCGAKASVCVRFCPILFELHPEKNAASTEKNENSSSENCDSVKENEQDNTSRLGDICKRQGENSGRESESSRGQSDSVFDLPYRMVFAVATESSVLLYDTQHRKPFSYLTNVHYHTLSDLTWSHDGRVLVVSSTDGFCTIITLSEGELGTHYVPPPSEPTPAAATGEVLMEVEDTAAMPTSRPHHAAVTTTDHVTVLSQSNLPNLISMTTNSSIESKISLSSSSAKRILTNRNPDVVLNGSSPTSATPKQPRRIQLNPSMPLDNKSLVSAISTQPRCVQSNTGLSLDSNSLVSANPKEPRRVQVNTGPLLDNSSPTLATDKQPRHIQLNPGTSLDSSSKLVNPTQPRRVQLTVVACNGFSVAPTNSSVTSTSTKEELKSTEDIKSTEDLKSTKDINSTEDLKSNDELNENRILRQPDC